MGDQIGVIPCDPITQVSAQITRQNQALADTVNVWRNYSPTEEILTEGYALVKNGVETLTTITV